MTSTTVQIAQNVDAGVPATAQARAGGNQEHALRYVMIVAVLSALGMFGIWMANKQFAPEMYHSRGSHPIAEAFSKGQNYAVFDLNLNIRELRNAHIAAMEKAPEVVILGASHWQEAHADLLPDVNFYNAHIHRDYYEDMLGMVEMFVRHDKLPRTMVIAIRDNLFTPVKDRKDHLWLPGIRYYRAMTRRIGLEPHSILETLPVARWREQLSAAMLFENVTRWYNADQLPQASDARYFPSLDTLLPDGSIIWSRDHRALFTPARADAMALEFAAENANRPPQIDPKGVVAIEALLSFLTAKGVNVVLAHPPFNPIYFQQTRGTRYTVGLQNVEDLTRRLAQQFNLRVIGSFNPAHLGCTADMYIDAEHAGPACLQRVFDQLRPAPDQEHLAPSAVANAAGNGSSWMKQAMSVERTRTQLDAFIGSSKKAEAVSASMSVIVPAESTVPTAGQPVKVAVGATREPQIATILARLGEFEPERRSSLARTAVDQVSARSRQLRAVPVRDRVSRIVTAPRRSNVRIAATQMRGMQGVHAQMVWPGDDRPSVGGFHSYRAAGAPANR